VQFDQVKTKPVEHDAMFALVKNYLSTMGYVETLTAFDEKNQTKELQDELLEAHKAIQFKSPVKERRMTMDQSDPTSGSKEETLEKLESAKKSIASKSQLSHETETMLQLQDDKSPLLSRKASGFSQKKV